ncbi:MAG: PepSY-associated TM helix domain-containing protein [Deltaproteobacteria bacterium]|nr:PepSY-associated TM helix domain-containing protein [Deltaproteobacteria bacterium]
MGWRQTLVWLHRDLGFFGLGLTVVYAVSGVAVNHREHWDYNHAVTRTVHEVGRPAVLLGGGAGTDGELARARQAELVTSLSRALGRAEAPRKAFWRAPDRLGLFYADGETDVVDYTPSRGTAEWTRKTPRPVLREFNMLHLNERRQAWTYVADGYALVLLFLGVSGVLIVKGPKGLRGRGGMLAVAGVLVPLLALWLG